jgi:hypothetical protein
MHVRLYGLRASLLLSLWRLLFCLLLLLLPPPQAEWQAEQERQATLAFLSPEEAKRQRDRWVVCVGGWGLQAGKQAWEQAILSA